MPRRDREPDRGGAPGGGINRPILYALLKQAAVSPKVRPLLDRIGRIRPLTVDAAAGDGWFDLQIGQETFGPLPAEDQAVLQLKVA